jgi:translocation and assembly module TamA
MRLARIGLLALGLVYTYAFAQVGIGPTPPPPAPIQPAPTEVPPPEALEPLPAGKLPAPRELEPPEPEVTVDPPPPQPFRPFAFRVEIDAPRPYRQMLVEGLPLVRWQGEQRVTLPLLKRLVTEAEAEASEALAAEGYFSAVVQGRIEAPPGADAVVHLTVTLGPRTRVREVDLRFRGAVLDDREGGGRIRAVRETWRLPPGEEFRQALWDAAKTDALARFGRGRYAAASIIESEARIYPEHNAADLQLELDSGPVFHAGPVRVTGLRRYPPSVVENFMPLRPGEPYDALKLELYQRRLLDIGYFHAVHFAIEADPALAAAAPLNIHVIEAPAQRVDLGLLYNTDTGPGITADYRHVNLFQRAWRLRSLFALSELEQRINLALDAPPRPGGTWDSYTAVLERTDIQNQISRHFVLGYGYNWGLEALPSQVSLAAHAERLRVAGATVDNNFALFGNFRRTFRTTDELVTPRSGVLGTVELGAAVPGLATRNFARTVGRVNWLIPAGPRNDVLVRGQAGVVFAGARDRIPSTFLFRTGGDQTIRGYRYESIGVPLGEAIVGGRYLALGSVEYTRWFRDTLGGAVFVDAGDAFDQLSAFDVAIGYGVGVRWRSPIGPVRGDVAYGQRDRRVRLHFSVGYTF